MDENPYQPPHEPPRSSLGGSRYLSMLGEVGAAGLALIALTAVVSAIIAAQALPVLLAGP